VDFDLGVRDPARLVEHPAEPLPLTGEVVRALVPLLTSKEGQAPVVLTGAAATEERVMATRSPRILLLDTHGVFGGVDESKFQPGLGGLLFENPLLRCKLTLAGCNLKRTGSETGEDGVLYGLEVGALDLRGTELVVLAACQSALGDVHAGQSAAGLRQAFQLAGARSVVATLWSVEVGATANLTIRFFEQSQGGKPAADALRAAQLELLRDPQFSHPLFWAAFTVTTQGRP
jgi:CHAT domain-containing protein